MVESASSGRLAEPAALTGRPTRPSGGNAAAIALGVAVALVGAAAAIGAYLNRPGSGAQIWAFAPPLFARWEPHVGPGSVAALVLAVAAVAWGPSLAARLPWRRLVPLGYGTAVAWTFSLAMIDGWERGFADRLTHRSEYLAEVPGITDIPAMLLEFTGRILAFQSDSWTTHVSGHPPGATLVFVWLDRIGLSGGVWASAFCVVAGALVAIAVPVTVDALGDRAAARATVPFAALLPGAIWFGVSADGMFAGVTASGVALLAVAARGRPGALGAAVGAGLLLGFGIFLSYGLVLVGVVALTVVILMRAWRVFLVAAVSAVAVTAVFAGFGFWWFDGYQLVVERYHQGLGTTRPYWYWVWANLAAAALAAGPALVGGAGQAVSTVSADRPWRGGIPWHPAATLALAALIAVALADASGLSKAEVERIWLPFVVWLLPATALLPRHTQRWWLAGQAATALVVNHLVWTYW